MAGHTDAMACRGARQGEDKVCVNEGGTLAVKN